MSAASVITFYSFKGGVGRTQALANVAVALANQGKRVILLDMDLESPGLPLFFRDEKGYPLSEERLAAQPGLIDYLEQCQGLPEDEPTTVGLLLPITHPQQRRGSLRLLTAGRMDGRFPQRIATFSWDRFYEECEGYRYLELLRLRLCAAQADYVLVDSRTGMTDVGAVCTFQLPDVVVVLFALHRQGIEGARRIAQAIRESREAAEPADGPPRPRSVLLLPSRVEETSELEKRNEWLQIARDELAGCGAFLSEEPAHLPYVPFYAFGESIAVRAEGDGVPDPLSQAYERLAQDLQNRCGEPPAPPYAGEPARSPLPLRRTVAELQRGLGALREDLQAFAASRAELPTLRSWGSKLQTCHEAFQQDLQRVQKNLSPWLARFAAPPGSALDAPRTVAEWELVCKQLAARVHAACEAFVYQREADWRARLLEAAEGDEAAVEERLAQLRPFADSDDEDDERALDARVQAAARELREQALLPRLRAGTLSAADLAARFPDPARQGEWLDLQLRRLVDEGATELATGQQLFTLLSLRLGLSGARPEPLHFSAYDLSCLLWPQQEPRRFPEVGGKLWRHAWESYFASIGGKRDPLWPLGTASRQVLADLDRDAAPELATVVAGVRAGLEAWPVGSAGWQDELGLLFERRQDDPCLRKALAALGQQRARAKPHAALLALWLCTTPGDVECRRAFVRALHSGGDQAPEAFYALCTHLQDTPEDEHREEWNEVLLSFLVARLRGSSLGSEDLALLLNDELFLRRLLHYASGWALLAIGAGYLQESWSWPAGVPGALRERLLRDPQADHRLPAEVRRWLERVRNQADLASALKRAERISNAYGRVLELSDESFFKTWGDSVHYESEFNQLSNSLLEEVLNVRSPAEAEQAERRIARDCKDEDWMTQTHNRLRTHNPRVRYPDGAGKRNVRDAFRRLREGLNELLQLRDPDLPSRPRDFVELQEDRRQVRRALQRWLNEPQDPLRRRLLRDLAWA